MKMKQHVDKTDDMREEYDFASMKGRVRGRYLDLFDEESIMVSIDSDVAKMFPDSRSVNEALRTLARVLQRPDRNAQQGTPADLNGARGSM